MSSSCLAVATTTMATASVEVVEPDRVPSAVYLDTSVAVAALFKDMTNFRTSASFCGRLVSAGSRGVFSKIVSIELSQVLARLPYDQQVPEAVRRRYRLAQ